MFIGTILQERMNSLNKDTDSLSKDSFVDSDLIKKITNNIIGIEDIDSYDLELISDVLFCSPEYFTDEKIRRSDLINSSYNRGTDTFKTAIAKGQIQNFARDFLFVDKII